MIQQDIDLWQATLSLVEISLKLFLFRYMLTWNTLMAFRSNQIDSLEFLRETLVVRWGDSSATTSLIPIRKRWRGRFHSAVEKLRAQMRTDLFQHCRVVRRVITMILLLVDADVLLLNDARWVIRQSLWGSLIPACYWPRLLSHGLMMLFDGFSEQFVLNSEVPFDFTLVNLLSGRPTCHGFCR